MRGTHRASSDMRRNIAVSPNAGGMYHIAPALPQNNLRRLHCDRITGYWISIGSLHRELHLHCAGEGRCAPSKFGKGDGHYRDDQHLLVLRSLRHKASFRSLSEEKAGIGSIWSDADHLHYGMPDTYHSWLAWQDPRSIPKLTFILALFSLVQFAVNTPALYTNTLTCVVIFLPLSSLWASASLDSRFQASKEQHYGNKMIPRGFSAATGRADVRNSNGPLSPAGTNGTGTSGSGVHSPHNAGQGQALQDLEAQGMVETGTFGNQ